MSNDIEQKNDKKGIAPEGFKTHGEQMHHAIFNSSINFWLNLTASAAFSFWVAHSHNKIKLPGMKEAASPSKIQEVFGDWLLTTPIFKGAVARKGPEKASHNAHAFAEVATLLTPGFAIMVPSVWLGEKFKKPIVRYFDQQKYGDRPEDNPLIAERYALIDQQPKPTLLGSTVARVGSMALTLTTSRLIGAENNWLNGIGKAVHQGKLPEIAADANFMVRGLHGAGNFVAAPLSKVGFISDAGKAVHDKFPGVNPIAGKIGDYFGDLTTKILPDKWVNGLESFFTNHNYRWSRDQIKRAKDIANETDLTKFANQKGHAFDVSEARNILDNPDIHNRPIQNFSKYLSMDVLYTAITAGSVFPVLSLIGVVPGMRYTSKEAKKHEPIDSKHIPKANFGYSRSEAATVPALSSSELPSTKIEQAEHQDRIERAEHKATR